MLFLSIQDTVHEKFTGFMHGANWFDGISAHNVTADEAEGVRRVFHRNLQAVEISEDEALNTLRSHEALQSIPHVERIVSEDGRTAEERNNAGQGAGDSAGGPTGDGAPNGDSVGSSAERLQQIAVLIRNLDEDEDDAWTDAGLPAVEAISEALKQNVTRDEITAALPDFKRGDA